MANSFSWWHSHRRHVNIKEMHQMNVKGGVPGWKLGGQSVWWTWLISRQGNTYYNFFFLSPLLHLLPDLLMNENQGWWSAAGGYGVQLGICFCGLLWNGMSQRRNSIRCFLLERNIIWFDSFKFHWDFYIRGVFESFLIFLNWRGAINHETFWR